MDYKRSIAKRMFYSDKMMFNSDTVTLVNNNDFSNDIVRLMLFS